MTYAFMPINIAAIFLEKVIRWQMTRASVDTNMVTPWIAA